MNPDLDKLQPYPFQRLNDLKRELTPPGGLEPIMLSIGEPKHKTPAVIKEALLAHLHGLESYPLTRGSQRLREAIVTWLNQRFNLPAGSLHPDLHVLPVNGTREALFAIAQCIVDRHRDPLVLMPNPFYQIYEGAALLAGAQPYYLNCTGDTGYLPDFDNVPDDVWRRCQLLYVCTPGNPAGAILNIKRLQKLIRLAETHDFLIASDECYSEIYPEEHKPPPGLLEAAAQMGNTHYRRCMVFHSLSKRSNAPGLRSGFVAGDAGVIKHFLRFRTYHGCAMPPPTQTASIAAWADEDHVIENRRFYREKFAAVLEILTPMIAAQQPAGGFYLWLELPGDDQHFAQTLFEQQHVTVLPGCFLSRNTPQGNPGARHVRIALVTSLAECTDAAYRMREVLEQLH